MATHCEVKLVGILRPRLNAVIRLRLYSGTLADDGGEFSWTREAVITTQTRQLPRKITRRQIVAAVAANVGDFTALPLVPWQDVDGSDRA